MKNRIEPILLILLSMGSMGVMGGSIIAPSLPILLEPFQISEESVGFILSVLTLSAAFSLPITGVLLDLLGRRLVGICSLLINGFFGVLSIFSPNFRFLLLFSFIQGFGIAALLPVAMTIISDWYSNKIKIKAIGFLSGTVSASAVLFPLIGGYLGTIKWEYPFLLYSCSFFTGLFFIIFIEETKTSHRSNISKKEILFTLKDYFISIKKIFLIKGITESILHSFFLYFSLFSLVSFIPLYMVLIYNLSIFNAGLALSIQGLFSALVSSQYYKIGEKLKLKNNISLGFSLISLSLLLIPLVKSSNIVFISLGIYGIGLGIIQPTIYNQITSLPPKELIGMAVAIFSTTKYLGMSLAPIVLRFVYISTDIQTVFIISSIICILWLLLNRLVFK